MELIGTYSWPLVVGSIMAAIGSAFVAISIVPRLYNSAGQSRSWLWVIAFGMSLGAGIWTMHFIAILALKLPITFTFDLLITILSLLLAIVASAVAIAPLRTGGDLSLSRVRTYIIGTLMGLAIAGMHYSGMAALRLNAIMQHDMRVVILAISIAIVASIAALAIANQLRDVKIFSQIRVKLAAATIMGLAVSAMHYTAMEGMSFYQADLQVSFESTVAPIVLAFFLTVIAFLIQGGAIVSAIFEENYALTKAATESMKRRVSISQALSEILVMGLRKDSLKNKMEAVLGIILRLDYLSVRDTGAIFITHPVHKKLELIAQHNLPPELVKRCKQVEFGECLCGMAAESQKFVFKRCLDHEHTVRYPDIKDHGHYCVPVVFEEHTLAVINLYLEVEHLQSDEEQQFLYMVADALAAMIKSHYVEEDAQKIFAAIDQAGEAVLISDTDGKIEYINSAFSDISGYSAEEALGQKTSLLKSGEQDEPFYKKLWDTILSGEVWQGEIVQKRKDETTYPAMLTISPSRNRNGEITHYIGIQEDLSEHKALEAQFRQAQKMEAVGVLVGGIAHDFNNMLAAMTGNIYLARKNAGDAELVKERLDSIEAVSRRAAGMIQKLLTFSRKDLVNMGPLSFSGLVEEVIGLLRSSIPENISVKLEIKGDDLIVFGDSTLLHQVIMNLMVNAKDAVEGVTHPEVKVSVEPFHADESWLEKRPDFKAGDYAYLSIADNGTGISEEDSANIFEPFFTTKEEGKGTGLGLSMVFGAVQSHSGFISVDSTQGRGTVFHLYFPLIHELVIESLEEDDSEVLLAKGETILLVDDERIVREAVSEVLESQGYKVLQAGDGIEGLEVFKSHHQDISLAVLDVVMPRLGGFELSKQMRKIMPSLPTVFVTGYDRENALKDCSSIKNCEVIMKPVHFHVLSRTIRGLLD